MLQSSLKLEKAANSQFPFKVFSKEVGGESRAAASRLQGVSCSGAVTMSHSHTSLRANYTLHLQEKDSQESVSQNILLLLTTLLICCVSTSIIGIYLV